jgi:DNA polymerase-3 subunit epsilon
MRQHGLSRNGELIILQRFHGGVRTHPERAGGELESVLFVDVETTGLRAGSDPIIELAAVLVDVEPASGEIVAHHRTVSWLEDPGRPIPPEIERLTGIRDADVSGRRIPDDEVRALFGAATLAIAHNARFDRAMCAARFPWIAAPAQPIWGCSFAQIDWRGYGHRHGDLESLGKDHGFFFDAHRATLDVEALIKLLSFRPDVAGAPTYLAELIADVRRPYWQVAAAGTPFEARFDLRDRRYRWDPDAKHWHAELTEEQLEAELDWIRELCARWGAGRPLAAAIPPAARFDTSWRPGWEPR